MLTTPRIKELYKQIQKKLFYMIPEKWSKIYLYASVIERINNIETGEMFFYYFPKGILKKDPINVYEIPAKYNIEEDKYIKLAEDLYEVIKTLRREIAKLGERLWSTITISIVNNKFIVEYDYEDITKSSYDSYQRHIIWRYLNLDLGIHTFAKEERNVILEYLKDRNYVKEDKQKYVEGIYSNLTHNIIDYDTKDNIELKEILKNKKEIEELKEETTNQLLNFNKF